MGKYSAPSSDDYYESLNGFWPRGPRRCADCGQTFTAYGHELTDPQFLCRECFGNRLADVLERERESTEQPPAPVVKGGTR